ncbi:hypothetical protein ACFL5L_05445, partial [candidate division KSB1 bacterium]
DYESMNMMNLQVDAQNRLDAKYEGTRQLYVERVGLGGIYTIIGGIASGASGGDWISHMQGTYSAEIIRALARTPPQRFILEFEEKPIEFPCSFAQFRGINGRTDLELYLGLPHDQLTFTAGVNGYAADVKTELVVIDSMFDRIKSTTRDLRIREDAINPDKHTLSMETVSIDPGEYVVGIQAKQEEADRLGIYQPEVNVRDLSGPDLILSDIRICSDTESDIQPEITARDQLELKPYPFYFVKKSLPLTLYFEIYNLTPDAASASSYNRSITIEPADSDVPPLERMLVDLSRIITGQKSGSIAITDERISGKSSVYEMIVVDISQLIEQNSTITVTVEDNISGKSAVTVREIKIIQ